MIDDISGLAIMTDVMLKELEESPNPAKKGRRHMARTSESGADFLNWAQSTILEPDVARGVST